jgi:hypothetical protein
MSPLDTNTYGRSNPYGNFTNKNSSRRPASSLDPRSEDLKRKSRLTNKSKKESLLGKKIDRYFTETMECFTGKSQAGPSG